MKRILIVITSFFYFIQQGFSQADPADESDGWVSFIPIVIVIIIVVLVNYFRKKENRWF